MESKIFSRYIVKVRIAFPSSQSDDIEFIASEKVFENEALILAREEAFNYRNLIIAGLLDNINKLEEAGWNKFESSFSKIGDREIRKLLNPFLEPENESNKTILKSEFGADTEFEWTRPDDTLSWYAEHNNGIWVIFEHNDPAFLNSDSDEIVIDKITRYDNFLPTPPLYSNLELEYKFYKNYQLDTKTYEAKQFFFDDEEYLEGGTDEQNCYISFNMLYTPFDWAGYDKVNWWKENASKNEKSAVKPIHNELPVSMNEAFQKGESVFSEYKPGLINWLNSTRDIEYEIAKTIAAFLNAKGGYLFIGVADKKRKILGIEFPNNSKDEFLREFTRIKAHFLPVHIAHTVNGDFYLTNGIEIFVVTVFPSSEPVFLKRRDENDKILKEFHVRSDASSRHIYDIEAMVKYCRVHWKS